MGPELFDPEKFNLKDSRQTKHSDRYALGMVIYEVLSGQVPFFRHHGYGIIGRITKGERPGRPQGEEGAWFTDNIWGILECCWEPNPSNRPNTKDVLRCLEDVSRSWKPPSQTVAGPLTINLLARNSGSGAEESMDEGEVSSPSQAVSSQSPKKLPLKGNLNKIAYTLLLTSLRLSLTI